MSDLLVKLYDLKQAEKNFATLVSKNICIRRGLVAEKFLVTSWVRKVFGEGWMSECDAAFSQQPVGCFVAIQSDQLLGFSCYNTTFKGFFGPIGVDPAFHSCGIGKALLLGGLNAMYCQGYAYAVIGGVGPQEFFKRSVNAFEIPDSTPGAYAGMLKKNGCN